VTKLCRHREAWRGDCGCWMCGRCNDSRRCTWDALAEVEAAERSREFHAQLDAQDRIRQMRVALGEDPDVLAARMMALITDGPRYSLTIADCAGDERIRHAVHLLRHGPERIAPSTDCGGPATRKPR
jgi:hypothetical protein